MSYRDRANALTTELFNALRWELTDRYTLAMVANRIEQELGDALFEERQPKTVDAAGLALRIDRVEGQVVISDAQGRTLVRFSNPPAEVQPAELAQQLVESMEQLAASNTALRDSSAELERRASRIAALDVTLVGVTQMLDARVEEVGQKNARILELEEELRNRPPTPAEDTPSR